MAEAIADREVVVTRLFDAPRETVFEAFTEKQHVENWWVPSGTKTHEWSAKPGGIWRYTMPTPDGSEFPVRIQFVEVAKPDRLVYDYATDMEGAGEPVRTKVTFEDQNGKTRVTLQLVFASVAEREEAMQYDAAAGAQQALKSLADYLSKEVTAKS